MKPLFFPLFLLLSVPIFAQQNAQLSYRQIDSIVDVYYRQGAFNKSISYLKMGENKALAEKEDSIQANYISNLGFFYRKLGQYEKALEHNLKAKNIYAQTLGEEHPFFSTAINNLALTYFSIGDFDKAELLYLQCIKIREKVLGKDHYDYATALNNLALLYANTGATDKAENLYLQSKKIYLNKSGENHSDIAMICNNLAGLYMKTENYEKAEPLYLNALNVYKKTSDKHPNYAQSINNLANLYLNMRDYDKAEPLFLQSLSIIEKSLGKDYPIYTYSLNGLALLYSSKKDYKQSEKLYTEALLLQQKNGHRPTNSLNNLAVLYKNMKDYKKAENFYFQSIATWEKFGRKDEVDFAILHNNIVGLYLDMEKLDTALHYSLVALDILSKDIDSSFYAKQEDGTYSAITIQKWTSLDKYTYSSNEAANTAIVSILKILELQFKQTKNLDKMSVYHQICQAAIRLNQRIRNEFSGEKDKLRNLASNNFFVLGGIKSALLLKKNAHQAEAFGFAEMNKGVLLMDAVKTEFAYSFGDLPDSLMIQERKLQKQKSSLQATLLGNPPAEIKDSLINVLNKVLHNIDDFAKKLKTNYPQYASLKYENANIEAIEVQKKLDDKTALIEYAIGDSVLYIFYIDKNNITVKEIPLDIKLLASKISLMHNALSNYKEISNNQELAYENFTFNSYWFYETLIAPILPLKNNKSIKNLIIIPDGELGYLPFETFLVERAPQKKEDYSKLHYLVQDYAISYNYSATLWARSKSIQTRNNGQLLALASNYEIALDTTKKDWRLPAYIGLRSFLQPLPAARKEVQILESDFQGFFGLDLAASEKVFKEKASDFAIIHLAMHGLLDNKNPILSSLAFTEDSDSLENNFLHAYEISKMKLNADLVVLSACETGFGKFEKGNGITSLAQAFAYAGASAMIVSLWQVNDFATSEIMKGLYKNLAEGMNKDEALRQAKLQYMKIASGIAAHPAFWSPFILMGNTDVVYLKTKGGWLWWGIAGVGALLGIGLFLRLRKK